MRSEALHGKRILILGYGLEGKATEAWLKQVVPDATIVIADRSLQEDYLSYQDRVDIVVKTPGIPKRFLHVPYITATNLFFAHTKNRVIGVTGSKGKSTTASLIAAILREAGLRVHLVGNIGVPALAACLEPVNPSDWFVMELSSYQLEDIQYAPQIAVMTTLFPEHLNYHGSFEAYVHAKFQIVAHASASDRLICTDEAWNTLHDMGIQTPVRHVPIRKELFCAEDRMILQGDHNRQNMRIASTVAEELGIAREIICRAIETFQPLPHRLQHVGTYRGITFYNDANSTVPEATICAMQTLTSVETLFLGGEDRGLDYTSLATFLAASSVRTYVFFPESGARMEAALRLAGAQMHHVLHTRDMAEAVRFAYMHTHVGSICLLSTAAPSYGVWKNFEEKGELFMHAIRAS